VSGGTPASGTLSDTQVRAMFDRIARIYDLLNSVMTAGMHHAWRRRAADLARVGRGSRALDVATGTGDLAQELAGRGASVTGMDFSPAMLALAREKAPGIEFEEGDALALRYDDGDFDAVTVGFGARNFSDLDRGLREMARVTKPDGRVVVLEITTPQRPPLSWFFRLWFDRVVPVLGRLAGDSDAYTYLPSSVRRFPSPEELAERMAGAGLRDVRWILTASHEHDAGAAGRRPRGRRPGAHTAPRADRGAARGDRRQPRHAARRPRRGDPVGGRQAAAPDTRLSLRGR
jgi:demethylmenaquinone methyltransferase / 2-methoxy-6-polyprenyl-1,4-benzoquinol methylase